MEIFPLFKIVSFIGVSMMGMHLRIKGTKLQTENEMKQGKHGSTHSEKLLGSIL